jgi:hypothetical protein
MRRAWQMGVLDFLLASIGVLQKSTTAERGDKFQPLQTIKANVDSGSSTYGSSKKFTI